MRGLGIQSCQNIRKEVPSSTLNVGLRLEKDRTITWAEEHQLVYYQMQSCEVLRETCKLDRYGASNGKRRTYTANKN